MSKRFYLQLHRNGTGWVTQKEYSKRSNIFPAIQSCENLHKKTNRLTRLAVKENGIFHRIYPRPKSTI